MSFMARVYADLIRKGEKTIDNVPTNLKAEVDEIINKDKVDVDAE